MHFFGFLQDGMMYQQHVQAFFQNSEPWTCQLCLLVHAHETRIQAQNFARPSRANCMTGRGEPHDLHGEDRLSGACLSATPDPHPRTPHRAVTGSFEATGSLPVQSEGSGTGPRPDRWSGSESRDEAQSEAQKTASLLG